MPRSSPFGLIDHAAVEAALSTLEQAVDRGGWDQLPVGPLLLLEPADAPGLAVLQLPVPDAAWDTEVPVVLRALAAVAEQHGADMPIPASAGLVGVGLVVETWRVELGAPPAPGDTDPVYEVTQEMAYDRKLHTHPRRIENRMVYAAMTDGRAHCLMRDRGADHATVVAFDPGTEVEGGVPAALRRLLNAVLAAVTP